MIAVQFLIPCVYKNSEALEAAPQKDVLGSNLKGDILLILCKKIRFEQKKRIAIITWFSFYLSHSLIIILNFSLILFGHKSSLWSCFDFQLMQNNLENSHTKFQYLISDS